mmetsp:Transcript_698/g.2056  ORF Transcript_698/g.2056 Transcript_698/m.2056 type:complete len:102 (-) Transcript_698:2657-2962(-)
MIRYTALKLQESKSSHNWWDNVVKGELNHGRQAGLSWTDSDSFHDEPKEFIVGPQVPNESFFGEDELPVSSSHPAAGFAIEEAALPSLNTAIDPSVEVIEV